MDLNNEGADSKMPMTDRNGKNDDVSSDHKYPASFGRHDAHKHHDTMGDIVRDQGNHIAAGKYNHNVNFVDNQFQEVNPHSNNAGRHDGHKNHDTMGDIVQGHGNNIAAGNYNHDMNFVDNQFQEVNPHSDSAGAIQTDKDFHSSKS